MNAYNETTSNNSISSISSNESISESHGKLNTQQSIVEVHSPPRDVIPDVIFDKPALPLLPALSAPTFTPKSTLATSKSAPILSTLQSTPLSSPKSAPASPALASSKIPSTPPPPPPPPPPTPIRSIPPLQTQKSAPSTIYISNKTEVSKNIKFFNGKL